jgi:hypothetical protein
MVLPSRLRKKLAKKMFSSLDISVRDNFSAVSIMTHNCMHQLLLVNLSGTKSLLLQLTFCVAIVEDIRYQHQYRPVELSQRSPALAVILDEIKAGRFGDASVYEP